MAHPSSITIRSLAVGPLRADEHETVLEVLVRAMHTNPISLAVAGGDPAVSSRVLERLFGAGLRHLGWDRQMLVARDAGGTILGACGMLEPGRCQPTPLQKMRVIPSISGTGPRTLARVLVWTGAWAKRDTEVPHWHLGPVAVDPDLQGQGIGTALMRAFCDHVDAHGDAAWLETDKEINVRFYERFGFEVAHEKNVLGVPNWYMLRMPIAR